MSTTQLLVLGALAGFTIFLGLPIGRIKSASTRLKAALSAMATGILLFLLWDVIVHGIEPVEEALKSATDEGGSWVDFARLAVTFAAGATIGLMSLVYYDRWFGRQRGKAMLGPGAASAAEFDRSWVAGLSPAAWLALLIATGIGLHNFSEGLAIGQSAAQDQVTLALVLIIGFGLHNATEGFGIVAPLSGSETRPSWKFLALLGLIGGGPTSSRSRPARSSTS
jgi:ZIP family zinc transporter